MTTHTQTPVAAALLKAAAVVNPEKPASALANIAATSRHVYYDPMDDLDSRLTAGELKARTFASMAWSIDMMCINTARALFYDVYRETTEVNSVDAFNAYMKNVAELNNRGAHTEEIGFENADAWDTLIMLMSLRNVWHDWASKSSLRGYEPKQLMELMANEKQQAVNSLDRSKLQMMAEFSAEGDAVMTKSMLQRMEEMQNLRFKDSFELRRKLIPAINEILVRASTVLKTTGNIRFGKADDPDGEAEFHMLPVLTQYRLIANASRAVERTLTDLGTNRAVTMMEYAAYFREGSAAMKALNEVLKAPKFNDCV